MISDPGFPSARKAGSRGMRRLIFPLVLLAFLGLFVQPSFSWADGFEAPPLFLGVIGIVAAVGLLMFFTEVRHRIRNGGAWGKAARGAVSLTLRGEAVAKQRTVSGRPMRTVVVQHRGEQRYLHLLFAKDAPAKIMRQGPVTVEFFAGDDVEGPARLLLPNGGTLWAFTTRLGEQPKTRGSRGAAGAGTTHDSSAGQLALLAASDDGRRDDGYAGLPDDGLGDSAWSGSDGWTGGSSWGGDSGWSSSGGGGGGWSSSDVGGWSGGDSGGGGGGGDSGAGS